MNETWNPVVGFEGWYEVSDQGRVRSLDRDLEPCQTRHGGTRVMRYRGRILRPRPDRRGYFRVSIARGNSRRDRYIAHLVLEAFVGPRPEGMEACHDNGNKIDNALSNLRWDTAVANQHDKRRHGTHGEGEKHSGAKLNSLKVRIIRRLAECGEFTSKEISEMFHVSARTIRGVIARKYWLCVP